MTGWTEHRGALGVLIMLVDECNLQKCSYSCVLMICVFFCFTSIKSLKNKKICPQNLQIHKNICQSFFFCVCEICGLKI